MAPRAADAREAALRDAARRLGARARRDEPIGPRTTYRVGGAAALYLEAATLNDLDALAVVLGETGLPLLVLGRGSNVLVADRGYRGICLVLGDGFATVAAARDSGIVEAGAAAPLPTVARRSAAAGLRGLEWAVGVPGSVGGAVAMNAGGHGADTASSLIDASVYDLSGTGATRRDAASLGLAYRRSNLGPLEVVTAARFHAEPGDALEAEREIAEIVAWRREHQPGGRNAGSIFMNPPGDSAGRLIDAAGLKGHRVGSAEVSTKHANFIQADPGGSADDVRRLLDDVRALVATRTGVELVAELRLVGFDDAAPGCVGD